MTSNFTIQYKSVCRQFFKAGLMSCTLLLAAACDSKTDNKNFINLDDRISDRELQEQRQIDATDLTVLYFGFDLRSSPQEDSRQYLPFMRYLEAATGYKFELRFTPKNTSIVDALGTGAVHFAALGAVSYIQGNEKYGIVNLARGLNQEGKAQYQSMIVVNSISPIKSVSDLVSKRFAFGSIDSTQGHLIPRIILKEHDIGFDDLAMYEYTGSHRKCVAAVISSKFDACGMQDTMAKAMEKQGLIKILHASRDYPSSGIAVNRNLTQEVIGRVKQALLDFDPQDKHKNNLYHWSQTEMAKGFVAAEESDYQDLKTWLVKLDMLKLTSDKPAKK